MNDLNLDLPTVILIRKEFVSFSNLALHIHGSVKVECDHFGNIEEPPS